MNTDYAGIELRDKIKRMHLTNDFIIAACGLAMSASTFSNKLYGQRQKFTEEEIKEVRILLARVEEVYYNKPSQNWLDKL